MPNTPFGLIVIDGFGCRAERADNAVALAHTPALDRIRARYPRTEILSHGEAVGLVPGLMGNSEVGHMNIGSGRIVTQAIDRINRSCVENTLGANPAVRHVFDHALRQGCRLHLIGLVSDGGVHSHEDHWFALLAAAAAAGLHGDRVVMHAFTDGRDTAAAAAGRFIANLERAAQRTGTGVIGTVSGRYYAMDRDTRWERVGLAYDALVHGRGLHAATAAAAVTEAAARGETDEFIRPTIIAGDRLIRRGDAVFFVNFRADRARQLTDALIGFRDFSAFPTEPLSLCFASMTEYRAEYPFPAAFRAKTLVDVFGEVVAHAGLNQLRIAETEKYAHVTFFFNGGREEPFRGEDRILVPSPKVATYDLQPEMSAAEVTAKLVDSISSGTRDAFVVNFANPDMVGHTGNLAAAIRAVEAVDQGIGRIYDALLARGGRMLITADHGNCEMMRDPVTGEIHTAHTINPVPLHVVSEQHVGRAMRPGGRLCDVVPTLLEVVGLAKSSAMTGESLLR